jgi:hypothetical protein
MKTAMHRADWVSSKLGLVERHFGDASLPISLQVHTTFLLPLGAVGESALIASSLNLDKG